MEQENVIDVLDDMLATVNQGASPEHKAWADRIQRAKRCYKEVVRTLEMAESHIGVGCSPVLGYRNAHDRLAEQINYSLTKVGAR